MDYLARNYLRSRKIPSTACSGCGLGQCHKGMVQAIHELGYKGYLGHLHWLCWQADVRHLEGR